MVKNAKDLSKDETPLSEPLSESTASEAGSVASVVISTLLVLVLVESNSEDILNRFQFRITCKMQTCVRELNFSSRAQITKSILQFFNLVL